MHTLCARLTFLGFILVLPILIASATPRNETTDPRPNGPERPAPGLPSMPPRLAQTMLLAEVVVAAGVVFAGLERRRLLERRGLCWWEPGLDSARPHRRGPARTP